MQNRPFSTTEPNGETNLARVMRKCARKVIFLHEGGSKVKFHSERLRNGITGAECQKKVLMGACFVFDLPVKSAGSQSSTLTPCCS